MKRSIFCLVLFLSAAMSLHAQTAPDAAKLTALLNEFLAPVPAAMTPPSTTVSGPTI